VEIGVPGGDRGGEHSQLDLRRRSYLRETWPANARRIGGAHDRIRIDLITELRGWKDIRVVMRRRGRRNRRIAIGVDGDDVAGVDGFRGLYPDPRQETKAPQRGLVLAVAGVDVLLGLEEGGSVEGCIGRTFGERP
jgi:hypothetical protein